MAEDRSDNPHSEGVDLAESFGEIARQLVAEKSLDETLGRVCHIALAVVQGCDHASISLIQGRSVSTAAASDGLPKSVDAIQYETNEGPCLDAIREHEVFRTDDLSGEDRWQQFAQRAAEATGVRSLLSFRLFADGDTMGALNLYSTEANAFDDDAERVGAVLAAHAAVAMVSALRHEKKDEAMRSRDVIGQAKGILMARQGITEDQAFELLVRASQRMNRKLREVAAEVAERAAVD